VNSFRNIAIYLAYLTTCDREVSFERFMTVKIMTNVCMTLFKH